MSDRKHTDATVVLLEKVDSETNRPFVLLGRKTPHASYAAGRIVPPGGKREPGESFKRCAVRELKDETEVDVDEESLELVAEFWSYLNGEPHFYVRVYIARTHTGVPQASREMVPDWYPVDALPFGEMLEGDEAWVPRVLAGERLSVIVCKTSHMWSVLVLPMVVGAEKAAADP
ncbi:NUDIX domain-containing protein [Candidatus Kaiserbacteria bacterium]|nr:NUDIX domain-containing protein [Candidatus Kaiserbacteria bacterium]